MVTYTRKEENINIITHVLGFLLTLGLFIPVIAQAIKSKLTLTAVAWTIYTISIAIMFLASSLYHTSATPALRQVMRSIDHGAIYLTIAGSYTPVVLLGIQSKFVNIFFVVEWILALGGIIMNIIAFATGNEDKIAKASMIIYLSMGWMSLLLIYHIIVDIGLGYLIWLFLGGLMFTIGAFFYKKKSISYNHAIWHVFIMLGVFTMYAGNLLYLG